MRNYPHFDLPLSFEQAQQYVTSPSKVSQHSFYPFIAFDLSHRRYKGGAKVRPIRMAAHLDGYIFSYYAKLLSEAYEARNVGTPLAASVIAYRKGLGSNIHFAEAAFREVERRRECVALAFDVKSFFDNIDHKELKRSWSDLLGTPRLPDDHYAVFRAVTRYAVVDKADCYARLGIGSDGDAPRPLCAPKVFREQIRANRLILTHSHDFGIPQGSQISAVLSNVYMLRFDERMCALAGSIGGYYRRYCDDLLWICDHSWQGRVQTETRDALSSLGSNLRINDAKTVVSLFTCSATGNIACDGRPLQYLGFEYDGRHRLVRGSTLSRYWRKAIVGIRSTKRKAAEAARLGGNPTPFRRGIYERYTHLGQSNFIRYALRASRRMKARAIRRQVAGHWRRIQEEFEKP